MGADTSHRVTHISYVFFSMKNCFSQKLTDSNISNTKAMNKPDCFESANNNSQFFFAPTIFYLLKQKQVKVYFV